MSTVELVGEQTPAAETPTEDRRGAPRDRGFAAAVGIPTLVLAVHSASYGPWIEDDAGITFAYARSIATGAGPVLQPGAEAVEGFSNPLWLAVLVVGHWLGLFDHGAWFGLPDLVLFPKLVALACAAAMFAVLYGLARTVSARPVALTVVAGTVTALVPSFAIWTTSGLENGLYALLVVALGATVARAAVEGRLLASRVAVAAGALAGLAALTRPDGLIYLAVYPVVAVLLAGSGWRRVVTPGLRSVSTALVPVGLYLVWRLVTFGDWLPTTARAKRQELPGPGDLARPGELVSYAGWLAVVLAVAAVALALTQRSRVRTAVGVLLVPLTLTLVVYAVLAADWMAQFRFATPLWPLGAFVGVLAFGDVMGRCTSRRARVLALLAVALAVLASGSVWLDNAVGFRRNPTAPMCFVATSVGERINAYADILGVRDGTLAAVDGGGTALTSRLRFVDLSGLADARFAELWQRNDTRGVRDLLFDTVRPTFFKLDNGWSGTASSGLLNDPRLTRDYVVLISTQAGSGTWVRRDVVPDAGHLALARGHATAGFADVDAPFLRGHRNAWTCGPTLRTGEVS
ncbi:hypothetical protein Acsp06_16800 [Actinomycetospora sp. NBRC 106375]|uniref:hypothetical protein n=1 Tax=Actinomycetospora sp. NBRC 106375 TaxID=3032207 RepID=UPI0024A01563|nr:hypothetical protein [Actinomycetospora sp. NBRC 106375]GLZ45495.1 hypothetical protein Acsp06_16800 [Actinomycetospora sp. NBRC 106375]